MKTYITQSGDLWDEIAYRELGSVYETARLMECNLEYRNVYRFSSGVVLKLPEAMETAAQNASLPPWKRGREV